MIYSRTEVNRAFPGAARLARRCRHPKEAPSLEAIGADTPGIAFASACAPSTRQISRRRPESGIGLDIWPCVLLLSRLCRGCSGYGFCFLTDVGMLSLGDRRRRKAHRVRLERQPQRIGIERYGSIEPHKRDDFEYLRGRKMTGQPRPQIIRDRPRGVQFLADIAAAPARPLPIPLCRHVPSPRSAHP